MSRAERRVALVSLGCKANQYEVEYLRERLERCGCRSVPFDAEAEVYVINTCWVTGAAERKSRKLIRQALRRSVGAQVIVTGCYAEARAGLLREEFPERTLVVPNAGKREIPQLMGCGAVEGRPGISSFRGRFRAFVKVEDGCNQFCSYCCIPYVRGARIRSRAPSTVVEEVKRLVSHGCREIVLAGINLGLYGREFPRGSGLLDLMEMLMEIPGTWRLRLSSLEPHLCPAGLGTMMADHPRICPHLHLPLQSGDPQILRAMGRRYRPAGYAALVGVLRQTVPSLAVSSDVIVGFPGETGCQSQNTYQFIQKLRLSRLHVFRFSPRPGTPAWYRGPRLAATEMKRRSRRLEHLGEELRYRHAAEHLGEKVTVLVEGGMGRGSEWVSGYSEQYIRVRMRNAREWQGHLVRVRLIGVTAGVAEGVVVDAGAN